LNSRIITTLLAAIGLLAAAGTVQAQTAADRVYVIDARNEVAKSGFGLCWRTGYWTPAAAANDAAGCACDKDLMPKEKCAPPAPKPAPAPAAAAPKKCDFTATLKDDQTFAFGKATLNSAAMAQLDKEVLAKLSNCAEVKLVVVTGHTDRIGSQQTNQKLSEKRADAVKAYLMKQGVKANIETMGAGKTQAVPGVSCDDKLPKKKLVACLAPNRRTVVEVQGPAK
jgi:OOP family OmpA-OmpF porin